MSQSIGEQLCQAREARKMSLEQVAQATHIRLHYLHALENDEFERLPSQTQARGFLRAYARYLNLDLDASWAAPHPDLPPREAAVKPEAPPAAVTHAEQAEAIHAEVGARLRRQREILGLSLEDVERHTHLRVIYLKALESGRLADLPSPVQGRGMLNNYAMFLGMDPEPLLLRFAEGLQAGLAARQIARASTQPALTRPSTGRSHSLRNLVSIDLLAGILLVAFIAGFIIWGVLRISSLQSGQQPSVTAPSIADVLAQETTTPTPSVAAEIIQPPEGTAGTPSTLEASLSTMAPEGGTAEGLLPPEIEPLSPTETLTVPPFPSSAIQLYIVIQQRAWMRVTVDGNEEFVGRVIPGSAYLFSGKEQVEVLTGNGAALNVYFNQEDLGLMGIFGEVVYRVYTPAGVVAPTATLTLTSTPSVTPTLTSTPSVTPTPTLAP